MPIPATEISEIKEKFVKLRSFLATGNGAGLIASLTFLGTVLSNDSTQELARSFWWVVLLFVVGLLGSYAGLVAEIYKTMASVNAKYLHDKEVEGKDMEEVVGDSNWDKETSVKNYKIHGRIEEIWLSISSISLVTGTIYAMTLLYQMTSP